MSPDSPFDPPERVHAHPSPLTDTGQYAECEDGMLHRHGGQGTPATVKQVPR